MDRSCDNPFRKGRKLHWLKDAYEQSDPVKQKNLKNEIKMI
jgi:hypothetical protein